MKPSMVTVYRRVAKGEPWESAYRRPPTTPRWMWDLEQQEGRPLREVLEGAARAAGVTGYGLSDLAREWGVPRKRLRHWTRKWGIRFPCQATNVDRLQRARRAAPESQKRERQQAVIALVEHGSAHQVARHLGIGPGRVSDWKHGNRPVPDHHWVDVQALAAHLPPHRKENDHE